MRGRQQKLINRKVGDRWMGRQGRIEGRKVNEEIENRRQ